MGELITLDLPADAPEAALPWIVTFGPLDEDDDWGSVVCGPYERAHALAIAETVVSDEDLSAVVEPVLPHATVEQIRDDIEKARAAAEADLALFEEELDIDDTDGDDTGGDDTDGDVLQDINADDIGDLEVSVDAAYEDAYGEAADDDDQDDLDPEAIFEEIEPTPPPSAEDVRAGFARIAARLSAGV